MGGRRDTPNLLDMLPPPPSHPPPPPGHYHASEVIYFHYCNVDHERLREILTLVVLDEVLLILIWMFCCLLDRRKSDRTALADSMLCQVVVC